RDLPNRVQVVSIEAQEGIMKFHEKPNTENYNRAREKIDLLYKEMADGNYSEEQKSRVVGAKRELYNLSKSHNIVDDESALAHNDVDSNNQHHSNNQQSTNNNQKGRDDQLENDMITGLTGIDGATLKNFEAKHNELVANDPIRRKLREQAGTDWENQGYGSDGIDLSEFDNLDE